MARSSAWRRTCPEQLILRIEQALEAKVYLLRESGPTAFLLKEDDTDKNCKVFLGDPHTCSCPAFKKERELCIHILWVILRKFRIPKDSQVVYQRGLVEREINEVIYGALIKNDKKKSIPLRVDEKTDVPKRKAIDEEDICPICHVELKETKSKEDLTFCKFGCGNNIHLTCMKVWAEHQKTENEGTIKCPLCRADFGSYQALLQEYCKSKNRRKTEVDSDIHTGTRCKHCSKAPIHGRCYRCDVCTNYYICHQCFTANWHREHNFHFKKKTSSKWKFAKREEDLGLCLGLTNTLGSKDRTQGWRTETVVDRVEASGGLTYVSQFKGFSANRKARGDRRTSLDSHNFMFSENFSVSGMRLDSLLPRCHHEDNRFTNTVLHDESDERTGGASQFLLTDRITEGRLRTPKYLPPLPVAKERKGKPNEGPVTLQRQSATASNDHLRIGTRTDRPNECLSAESIISRRHKVRPVSTRRNLSAELLRRKTPSEPDLRTLNEIFHISGCPVNR